MLLLGKELLLLLVLGLVRLLWIHELLLLELLLHLDLVVWTEIRRKETLSSFVEVLHVLGSLEDVRLTTQNGGFLLIHVEARLIF